MIKSDDKFFYEDDDGKEQTATFSNFELLARKVDLMAAITNQQSQILKDNGLFRKVEPATLTDQQLYNDMLSDEELEEEQPEKKDN